MKSLLFFTLLCLPITAVNAQFFESFNEGIPNTWTVLNLDGGKTWNDTQSGWGGGRGLNIQSDSNPHNDYLISPQFMVTSGVSERISFHVRSYLLEQDFQVKLSTTGINASDFTISLGNETEPAAEFYNFTPYEYDLSAYIGQQVYVAIIAVDTGAAILYLDEFSNDSFNCKSPFALEAYVDSLTESSLYWRNELGQTDWNVQYGESGFSIGNGTIVSTTTFNAKISGLTSGIEYDYYVQANCGSNLSHWAGPYKLKQPIEGETSAFPITLDITAPDCSISPTYQFDYNNGFPFYAYPDNTVAYLTPCGGQVRTIRQGVWTKFTSPSNGAIEITTTSELDYFAVFEITCNENGKCNRGDNVFCYGDIFDVTPQKVINLEPNSEYALVIWRSDYQFEFPVSDICVSPIDCVYPIDLNALIVSETDSEISWTPYEATQTTWEYVVQPSGSGLPTGSGISTNNTKIVVSNTQNTENEFYGRTDCGDGTYSDWNGPFVWLQSLIPANNECTDAILLSANTIGECIFSASGNTLGATYTEDDNNYCQSDDEDVWYKFVATSETYDFEVIPTNPDFSDTNYTATLYDSNFNCNSPEDWEVINCVYNDEEKDYIIYDLIIGNTYYLRVSLRRYSFKVGKDASFDLCINIPPPPPSNNACSGAISLEIGEDYTGDTTWAYDVDDIPYCTNPDYSDDRGVWFKYRGSGTQEEITLNFCNRDFDYRLSVFSGDCGNLVCYADHYPNRSLLAQPSCDSGWNVQHKFVSDGTSTYYIFLKGGDEDEFGAYEFLVSGETLSVQNESLKSLVLYPNPVENKLIISNPLNVEIISIEVADINGRIIQKVRFNDSRKENSMSFDNYKSGIYFVRIDSVEGHIVRKVVKK